MLSELHFLNMLWPVLQLLELCLESFFLQVNFLVLFQFIFCMKGLSSLKLTLPCLFCCNITSESSLCESSGVSSGLIPMSVSFYTECSSQFFSSSVFSFWFMSIRSKINIKSSERWEMRDKCEMKSDENPQVKITDEFNTGCTIWRKKKKTFCEK